MYRTLNAPLTAQVETTWQCGNKCRWCYNFFRHDNSCKKRMALSQAKVVSEELIKCKILRCTITGGEPLINPKVTLFLAKKLKRNGMVVTINTNMNNFTEDIGKKLLSYGVKTLTVSMPAHNSVLYDWLTQNPGSFAK